MKTRLLAPALSLIFALAFLFSDSQAGIVFFKLTGNGGDGLLESNVTPGTGEPGTGDRGVNGIFFDDVTSEVTFDLEWGSGNGHTDLSTDVVRLHFHGPTPSGGSAAFSETGPVIINMTNSLNFNASATSGGIQDTYFLSATEAGFLLSGRTYINVHLSDTDAGMLRGYLVQVPEPNSLGLIVIVGLGYISRRKRRN